MRKIVLPLVIISIANLCYAQRRKRPIVTPIKANVTAETKAEISTRPPPSLSTTKALPVFKKLVTSSIALTTPSTTTRPRFNLYVPASDYRLEALYEGGYLVGWKRIPVDARSTEKEARSSTTVAIETIKTTTISFEERTKEPTTTAVPVTDSDLRVRVEEGQNSTVDVDLPSSEVEIGPSNSSQNKGQVSLRGKVKLNLI